MSQTKVQLINNVSGNSGFGTSSPQQVLHLNTASSSAANMVFSNTTTGSGASDGFVVGLDGSERGQIFNQENTDIIFGTNNLERMRLNNDGDLLIGRTTTIDTSEVFGIKGPSGDHCTFGITTDGTTNLGIIAFNDNDANFRGQIRYQHSTDSMQFQTAAAEHMRILSSGSVQIGRTLQNDDEKFGIFTDSTVPEMVNMRNNAAASTKDMITMIHVKDSGTVHFMRFKRTGSLSNVGGITTESNSTAFNTSSDYRLKENEVLISDGITRLKALKPYRFNFKTEPSKTVDGFFAHEVTPVVPEAVTGEKDAVETTYYKNGDTIPEGKAVGDIKEENAVLPQSLDYAKFTPLLTAALQEEIAKREALETRVAALEAA